MTVQTRMQYYFDTPGFLSTRYSSTDIVAILLLYVFPGFCEYKGKQYKVTILVF